MGVDQSPKNLGIKISQPFKDVDTAEDKDLIFSSYFPLLKEGPSGVIDMASVGDGSTYGTKLIYNHNLGYYPFLLAFDGHTGQISNFLDAFMVNKNELYFSPGVISPQDYKVRWIIYRLPVFEAYKSPSTVRSSSTTSLYSSDYGLKALKQDRTDIMSTDLRDFTLHSRARSPSVNEVNVKEWTVSDSAHTYKPTLPYNPLSFAYHLGRSSSLAYSMRAGGQAVPFLARGDDMIEIQSQGAATSVTSIITFKDPLLSPTEKQVIY